MNINQGSQKALTSSGGIGSLIESMNGCFLVLPIEKWPFFTSGNYQIQENKIEDKRLLDLLRLKYPKLEYLLQIPSNTEEIDFKGIKPFKALKIKGNLIGVTYFPRWMYCPACRRLSHYSNIVREWRYKLNDDINKIYYYINPPYCPNCAGKKLRKSKKFLLVQVPFILISDDGTIADIPFDKWIFDKNDTSEDTISYMDDNKIAVEEGTYLKYITDTSKGLLVGNYIAVYDKTNKRIHSKSIKYLFDKTLLIGSKDIVMGNTNKGKSCMRVVLRTSNSVYYINTIKSLTIPNEAIDTEIISRLKALSNDGEFTGIEMLYKLYLRNYGEKGITKQIIEKLVNEGKLLPHHTSTPTDKDKITSVELENKYRLEELDYFLYNKHSLNSDKLDYTIIDYDSPIFSKIFRVDKLEVINVQTGYTRGQSFIRNGLDLEADNNSVCKQQYPSDKYLPYVTEFLPAIKSYGEGILFVLDYDKIKSWEYTQKEVANRILILSTNYIHYDYKIEGRIISADFVLLHTFSHLFIKELEFYCGYPAVSLTERLYYSAEEKKAAVLIYTVAGGEGSYGGLVSLCDDPNRLASIITHAFHRAFNCTSDPVCSSSDPQGIGGLNLAACHNCALLTETSCEEWNTLLDRKLWTDQGWGFLKFCGIELT
jgi:hypothetical protein